MDYLSCSRRQCQCFFDDLNSSLQELKDDVELILLGDYNIKWNPKNNTEKGEKRKLSQLAFSHSLEQLIDEPTRVTESTATLIDMIFTNAKHRIADSGVIRLGLSDRFMIFCVFKAGVFKKIVTENHRISFIQEL